MRTLISSIAALLVGSGFALAQSDPPVKYLGTPLETSEKKDKTPAPTPGPTVVEPPSYVGGMFMSAPESGYRGLQAGAGLHMLKPFINNNFAFATINVPTAGGFSNINQNFTYKYDSAVSVWLGYTLDSGLGVRATWFHQDADSRGITVTNPFAGPALTTLIFAGNFVPTSGTALAAGQTDVFNLRNRIQIDSWDFDVSQQVQMGNFDLNLGAGLRHARIIQTANISRTRTGLAGGAVNFENELNSNSYTGWGPTVFVEAKRRLGATGFALYGSARGGVLFGTRSLSSENLLTAGGGGAVAPIPITTTRFFFGSDEDRTIGTGEIELGIEWNRRCGRFNPFVRAGYEGRGFTNTGSATGGTSNIGAHGLVLQGGVGF